MHIIDQCNPCCLFTPEVLKFFELSLASRTCLLLCSFGGCTPNQVLIFTVISTSAKQHRGQRRNTYLQVSVYRIVATPVMRHYATPGYLATTYWPSYFLVHHIGSLIQRSLFRYIFDNGIQVARLEDKWIFPSATVKERTGQVRAKLPNSAMNPSWPRECLFFERSSLLGWVQRFSWLRSLSICLFPPRWANDVPVSEKRGQAQNLWEEGVCVSSMLNCLSKLVTLAWEAWYHDPFVTVASLALRGPNHPAQYMLSS